MLTLFVLEFLQRAAIALLLRLGFLLASGFMPRARGALRSVSASSRVLLLRLRRTALSLDLLACTAFLRGRFNVFRPFALWRRRFLAFRRAWPWPRALRASVIAIGAVVAWRSRAVRRTSLLPREKMLKARRQIYSLSCAITELLISNLLSC